MPAALPAYRPRSRRAANLPMPQAGFSLIGLAKSPEVYAGISSSLCSRLGWWGSSIASFVAWCWASCSGPWCTPRLPRRDASRLARAHANKAVRTKLPHPWTGTNPGNVAASPPVYNPR